MLEVQTLHVRDITRDNRVQALGRFQDVSICRECAEKYLEKLKNPWKTIWKKILPFIIVLVFGIAVLIICWGGATALLVMGFAGILCGILGIVSTIRSANKKRKDIDALTPDEAKKQAAWECLLSVLPKKDGDNDMSYIPVDERTLKMKNGDLMIVYDLLPDIAVKAWKLIHGEDDSR